MKEIKIILVILVLALSIFLRFYQLDTLPPGLNADEASLGYDAYSILLTGKDQYGKSFPIFLRSFGAYQSPLYAYLTTIPIVLFGLSIFSVRFLSAMIGVVTVALTFVIVYRYSKSMRFWQALTAGLIISFAPWSIFFSRTAVEAHLGLFLMVLSVLFLLKSLEKPMFLIWTSVLLGISTYAYQAQRLGSLIILFTFILIFFKHFKNKKKVILIGLILFFIIQIPQLLLINTQAGTRRLSQVNYLSKDYFDQNGGALKLIPFGRQVYIFNQFSSHYLAYFSPKNLFFDPDPQEVRSMPDLSIFYHWMFIPLLFGMKVFWDQRKELLIKTLLIVMITAVVPAALTREPFYTLRVLPLFWVLSIMISFGGLQILHKLRFNLLKVFIIVMAVVLSLAALVNSYFVLLKYERSSEYGFPYIELAKKSVELSSRKFFVDAGMQSQYYIWFAFFKKYDPHMLQNQGRDVLRDYYNSPDFDGRRVINNVEIRPIVWGLDPCIDQIIVGDTLAISETQAKEHKLDLEFEISALNEKTKLKAYRTNPKESCKL